MIHSKAAQGASSVGLCTSMTAKLNFFLTKQQIAHHTKFNGPKFFADDINQILTLY